MAGENEKPGMGHHAVFGAQAIRDGLPAAHEDFADFDVVEGPLLQPEEELADLIHGGQEERQRSAGRHGGGDVLQRRPHIKEQGVRAGHVAEAFRDVLTVHGHVLPHPGPLQVPPGELVEFLPGLERMHLSGRAGEPRQGHGQAARSGARFDDRAVRPHAETHTDIPDILGIEDLRLAFDALDDIVQRGLLDAVRHAERRADFGTERRFDHIGHAQDAVLRVHVLIFINAAQAPLPLGGNNNNEISVCGHEFSLVSFAKSKGHTPNAPKRTEGIAHSQPESNGGRPFPPVNSSPGCPARSGPCRPPFPSLAKRARSGLTSGKPCFIDCCCHICASSSVG